MRLKTLKNLADVGSDLNIPELALLALLLEQDGLQVDVALDADEIPKIIEEFAADDVFDSEEGRHAVLNLAQICGREHAKHGARQKRAKKSKKVAK